MRRRACTALIAVAALLASASTASAAEDKREFAITTGGNPMSLRILSPSGALVRKIVERPSNNLGFPSWSPDEKTIAYFENNHVLLQPSAGGTENTLVDGSKPSFSPVADEVAYWELASGNQTSLKAISTAGGNPRTIAGPFTATAVDFVPPSWSPDGRTIAFASNRMGGPNIWIMDPNGASPKRLTTSTQPEDDPSWSIDGRTIVFDSKRAGGSNADVFTINPFAVNPESTLSQLTTATAADTEPVYSRDGQKIAFTSGRDRNQEIYVMNPNGSAQTRVTVNSADDRQPDW